jgi:hypothetical protein
VNSDERQLWRLGDLECVMISCCSGAELQLRQVRSFESLRTVPNTVEGRLKPDTTEDAKIVLRELYPTKSDLYERARDLKAEYDQKEPRRPASSQRE